MHSASDNQNYEQVQRNHHADLIRIIAMIMVCILHVARMSGFLHLSYDDNFAGKLISNAWESPCIIAVNLYAILTGFLCVNRSWNIKRFINLWITVCFYSIVLYIPATLTGELMLGIRSTLSLLNPFTSCYWYFAAYSGLFIILPYLNKGLLKLSEKEHRNLLLLLIFGFSILGCWNGRELAQNGHTAAWLIIMYITGAYIRLHGIHIKKGYLLAVFIISIGINFVALLFQGNVEYIIFRSYTSFSTTFASISFFVLILTIPLRTSRISNFLKWLSPMAFSVYLIHCHPYNWQLLTEYLSKFATLTDYACWFIPAVSIVLYMICSILDLVRIHLFRLIKADIIASRLTQFVPNFIQKLNN